MPTTSFTGLKPPISVNTFIRKFTATPLSIDQLTEQHGLEIEKLQEVVLNIHAVVQVEQAKNRNRGRQKISTGKLPNFTKSGYVLGARFNFSSGEKPSLRWPGPRRTVKTFSDYVFLIEDIRTGSTKEAHITRLKFYRDAELKRTR